VRVRRIELDAARAVATQYGISLGLLTAFALRDFLRRLERDPAAMPLGQRSL
jgi:hypothetical protein